MIKSWQIFNESNSNELTKEQAKEIIYYFSEDSSPSNSITADFYSLFGDHFIYYEAGYEDMKQFVKDLLSKCKGNELITNRAIDIYNRIRKEREIFPEAFEIEEIFADFMDLEDFTFMIYSTDSEYRIRLSKDNVKNLDSFIKYCQDVRSYLIRLKSPDYFTKLTKCEFLNDYNINNQEYGWIFFEIRLKKIGVRND